ncbi:MAG TPA: zinc ribbon domain-containing protein, partial [Caldilineaceae bacterium]|nr:zinc ribbon domain-containing protein [Caldilineaceae bacterium]
MTNPLRERPEKRSEAGMPPNAPLAPAPSQSRPRQAMLHRCPNCGVINRGYASICPECGENLRATPRKINCRYCGKRASSILVICPNCGRELIAAPAQWLIWGIPALLVLLFLVLIATRWNALRPVSWLRGQLDEGTVLIEGLSTAMDPKVVIEAEPDTSSQSSITAQAEAATPEAAVAEGDLTAPAIAAAVALTASTTVVTSTAAATATAAADLNSSAAGAPPASEVATETP